MDTEYHGTVELPPLREARLDRYIADVLRLMTRSQIKARGLRAVVNGRDAKPSRLVRAGDALDLSWEAAPPLVLLPEDIPLDIVYEDDRVIVVNKPQGLVVHPGAGNRSGTLANALLWRANLRLRTASGSRGPGADYARAGWGEAGIRPFIVHRLDKDTSGLLIAAWDSEALAFLSEQFRARTVRKTYAAVVIGRPASERGVISANIARDRRDRKRFAVCASGGKAALTRYRVIRSAGGYSLLAVRPKTGRTHQIRVHLQSIGHPIAGDGVYGGHSAGASLALHAKRLEIRLPDAPAPSVFSTKLPSRFKTLLGAPPKG